ncbi:3,4-dihydroxy-2-butanone-4-phosphate synthase [Solemya pervernicosa gill symbiont]|uniref:3,4-dihydroxy-2-butanone 4-phosphate synthase n=2 Tax=Gammaproteobacteria incertae sedis TaxID=118884 RepID=A0A1T2L143_9GAMM|nr:bifunctional 3,4-dihydroxy-2-butanone-4-phosphate synthase/GTP cyclohydrolase II [Candidatus Reidiella endopervernicosa]OOZ38818.1 3,4-dihydroxy-2-butanone-4-phosphate synthase [Solemya pervernicosa gill symbiont]QKQ27435.1 3,4-dihydroxy-2-butanone-4-phosphate synthase [Candidatus Reidiella endopervernicosa]
MKLNSIEEILEDLAQGKMVIMMDDEDRENEGDLIMASSMTRPEDINFMARYGRGLICLTLTRERCQQLNLPLMVSDTNDKHGTNFTVSIEAAEGVTTGISAYDRALTVRKAVAPDAKAADIVQPGHIFPLMAVPGGVLNRAGHTEAGCDLMRLAGLEPSGVIVEILNEDGTMARRPDLEVFAKEHDLKIGTVADLIHYRIENEKTIERVAECDLPTENGKFRLYAYTDGIDNQLHHAMVLGEVKQDEPTLVRVHLADAICDIPGTNHPDCGWPLSDVLERIGKEGAGIAVLLSKKDDPRDLVRRMRNYDLADRGGEQIQHETNPDLRTYGIGAQILADLGVHKMRVMSAPKKMHGISGFDLEVVEYVSGDHD